MIKILIILIIDLAIGSLGWWYEYRQWNNGICKSNGLPWEYIDTDSQGGRGYSAGDEHIWISWTAVDC